MSIQTTEPETEKTADTIEIRKPILSDGKAVYDFVCRCGTIELNTVYCYFLLCSHFSSTSAVAVRDGEIVGFLGGYCLPEHPTSYFIWQVGVDVSTRGHGIAGKLINHVITRDELSIQAVTATISPSNKGSQRVLQKIAESLHAPIKHEPFLKSQHFGDLDHEAEDFYTIGPIPNLHAQGDHT